MSSDASESSEVSVSGGVANDGATKSGVKIKTPTFNGKKPEDWSEFQVKLKHTLQLCKCKEAIEEDLVEKAKALRGTTAETKKQKSAMKTKNEDAVSILFTAVNGPAFSVIMAPGCEENAYKMFEELRMAYGDEEENDKGVLIAKLGALRFEARKDPSITIREAETLNEKIGRISKEAKMTDQVLLDTLKLRVPEEYEHITKAYDLMKGYCVDESGNTVKVTLTTFKKDMKNTWKNSYKNKSSDYDEKAFNVEDSNTKKKFTEPFGGLCRYCGERGHKAQNCDDKHDDERNGNKKNMMCYNCNKKGHLSRDCPEKDDAEEAINNLFVGYVGVVPPSVEVVEDVAKYDDIPESNETFPENDNEFLVGIDGDEIADDEVIEALDDQEGCGLLRDKDELRKKIEAIKWKLVDTKRAACEENATKVPLKNTNVTEMPLLFVTNRFAALSLDNDDDEDTKDDELIKPEQLTIKSDDNDEYDSSVEASEYDYDVETQVWQEEHDDDEDDALNEDGSDDDPFTLDDELEAIDDPGPYNDDTTVTDDAAVSGEDRAASGEDPEPELYEHTKDEDGKPMLSATMPKTIEDVMDLVKKHIGCEAKFNGIGGTITNWQSKSQATVTFSSTEAEFIAMLSGTENNNTKKLPATLYVKHAQRIQDGNFYVGENYEEMVRGYDMDQAIRKVGVNREIRRAQQVKPEGRMLKSECHMRHVTATWTVK
jgi:uncharacterized protein YfkK (UPF0435 family)